MWTRRLANLILDSIALTVVGQVIFALFGVSAAQALTSWLLGAAIAIGYYTLFESVWGKSPAKYLTATKVVMKDGSKPSAKVILVRSLVRQIIIIDPLSYLFMRGRSGLHDVWSKTIVVRDLSSKARF